MFERDLKRGRVLCVRETLAEIERGREIVCERPRERECMCERET